MFAVNQTAVSTLQILSLNLCLSFVFVFFFYVINVLKLNYSAALWYGKEDNQKDKSMDNGVLDSDTDMDDEDGDSEVEGSADQSLEF